MSIPSSQRMQSRGVPSIETSVLPIYDVVLDLPHPAVYAFNCNADSSPNFAAPPVIIVPPEGAALETSRRIGRELTSPKGLGNIVRFAFPEFRDHTNVPSEKPNNTTTGKGLSKYDIYIQDFYFGSSVPPGTRKYDYPYIQSSGPSHYTYAMQLSVGDRVYGHVRRYLPHHSATRGRLDVGRRSMRAMVILTRHCGGAKFYSAVLKLLESITSHYIATSSDHTNYFPQQSFLHILHAEHTRLCALYTEERSFNMTSTGTLCKKSASLKTHFISASCIEFNYKKFGSVDSSNFAVPQQLLHPHSKDNTLSISTYHILPLLRCLGVAHIIRLFSALLCERRIILTSHSPSRLSACGQASMSILSQGLLHWQHMYVPILPPFLINYLAAPTPYFVGLMTDHANIISKIQGLSEVLLVDLDQNCLTLHAGLSAGAIPDLLRLSYFESENGNEKFTSIVDILKNDLLDILKADKKFRSFGESVQEKLVKGKEALKKGLGKLRQTLSSKKQTQREQVNVPKSIYVDEVEEYDETASEPLAISEENYLYGEGLENEDSEEEIRISFTIFFLCLMGEMRWYLNRTSPGIPPQFEKARFVESRVRQGDRQGTPMYELVGYFKETQAFSQFVRERINEIQSRKLMGQDAPIFLLAANYHRLHNIEFNVVDTRRIVKQFTHSNPNRLFIMWNNTMRKRAMALTSNSRHEASVAIELKRIVADCREVTCLLVDVMSVIWVRIRDSRGSQWKHALYALQLLLELVMHGPLSAVTEATDGLAQIRKLKFYENIRPVVTQQIQAMARTIYGLLVNRSKLFTMRRSCALRRKKMEGNPPPPKKANGFHNDAFKPNDFAIIHTKMNPTRFTEVIVQTEDLLHADLLTPECGQSTTSYAHELLSFSPIVPGLSENVESDSPTLHHNKHSVSLSGQGDISQLCDIFNSASVSTSSVGTSISGLINDATPIITKDCSNISQKLHMQNNFTSTPLVGTTSLETVHKILPFNYQQHLPVYIHTNPLNQTKIPTNRIIDTTNVNHEQTMLKASIPHSLLPSDFTQPEAKVCDARVPIQHGAIHGSPEKYSHHSFSMSHFSKKSQTPEVNTTIKSLSFTGNISTQPNQRHVKQASMITDQQYRRNPSIDKFDPMANK